MSQFLMVLYVLANVAIVSFLTVLPGHSRDLSIQLSYTLRLHGTSKIIIRNPVFLTQLKKGIEIDNPKLQCLEIELRIISINDLVVAEICKVQSNLWEPEFVIVHFVKTFQNQTLPAASFG